MACIDKNAIEQWKYSYDYNQTFTNESDFNFNGLERVDVPLNK